MSDENIQELQLAGDPGTDRAGQSVETCLILSSFGSDLQSIQALLTGRNITFKTDEDLPASSTSHVGTVLDAIQDSDLVLVILRPAPVHPDLLFEAGYAKALKKKILTIVLPGVESLPDSIRELPYVKADLSNVSAIEFSLEQVLKSPKTRSRRKTKTGSFTKPIGAESTRLLRELASLGPRPQESGLLVLVHQALRASGVSTIAVDHPLGGGSGQPPRFVDLAVWSDDLASTVGNPLLIEIKSRLTSPDLLQRTAAQARQYLSLSNTRYVLVLYPKPSTPISIPFFTFYPVLFMSIEDFLTRLQTESFGNILRSVRNRAIHGVDDQ